MTISDEEQKSIEQNVSKLMEHYDSVRIFVTRHDGEKDTTESFHTGGGNFYAQLGQVREWLVVQDRLAQRHADEEEED